MKKRVGAAYVASVVLAAVAFALLMLKLFGPATRWAAFSVYAVAWILLAYAIRRHALALRHLEKGARAARGVWASWAQEIVVAVTLIALGAIGVILLPPTDAGFLLLPKEQARELVRADAERARHATRGIARQAGAFGRLVEQKDPRKLDHKPALRDGWASYLDFAVELDRLIDVHEHFYQLNPVQLDKERADSFVIAFAALAAQLENGLAVRKVASADPDLERLLNEASPEHGVAAKSYFALTQGLVRADGLIRLQAGLAYLPVLEARGRLVVDGERELAKAARESALRALADLGKNADALLDNPLTYFEAKAFAAWFPLQKKVASTLGDLRVQHRPYFVGDEMLSELRPQLEPMDVLLERRNWYVTNIGLPGFWPHAALYVGDLETLDGYFEEDIVRARTGKPRLSEYLRERKAKVFAALERKDAHGYSMSVLEAISEGVVFQSFEHSGNADYLAVMRPALAPREKLEALLRAFEYHEKPYDFDFDFITDESIVCSELVYKSLEGVGELGFELSPSAGRVLLTPNQIAQKFDREYDAELRSFSFVAFLDGSEAEQTAHARDAVALRESWRRPKWDIVQP